MYAETVMPHLVPDGFAELAPGTDWAEPMGSRLSAVERYSSRLRNRVVVVQNVNDFHYSDHYLPFLAAARRGGNGDEVRTVEYEGPDVHAAPPLSLVLSELSAAIETRDA